MEEESDNGKGNSRRIHAGRCFEGLAKASFHLSQQFPGLAPELVSHARVSFELTGGKKRWQAEQVEILSFIDLPYVEGTVVTTHLESDSGGSLRFQLYGSTYMASYSFESPAFDVLPLLVRDARVCFLPVWEYETDQWLADDIRALGPPAPATQLTALAPAIATLVSRPTPSVRGRVVVQPKDGLGLILFDRDGEIILTPFRMDEQSPDLRPLLICRQHPTHAKDRKYTACSLCHFCQPSSLPLYLGPSFERPESLPVTKLVVLKAAPSGPHSFEFQAPSSYGRQGTILKFDPLRRYGVIKSEDHQAIIFHLDNQDPLDQPFFPGAPVSFVPVADPVLGQKAIGLWIPLVRVYDVPER
ncbi:hypothetical protein PAPYR_10392 [Paratrimastix pyriformis]|uniref:Uncharacterized protein n=1 Tax=Paratrimastix pyriformis TaxID=342808 RepID=A0ABQ8U658_9EUKA|nr:hypothetical protein PAPYR_10392 [Paratrimastix pyriformis]